MTLSSPGLNGIPLILLTLLRLARPFRYSLSPFSVPKGEICCPDCPFRRLSLSNPCQRQTYGPFPCCSNGLRSSAAAAANRPFRFRRLLCQNAPPTVNGGQIAKLHSLSVCLGAVVQVTVRASKMRRRGGRHLGTKYPSHLTASGALLCSFLP